MKDCHFIDFLLSKLYKKFKVLPNFGWDWLDRLKFAFY